MTEKKYLKKKIKRRKEENEISLVFEMITKSPGEEGGEERTWKGRYRPTLRKLLRAKFLEKKSEGTSSSSGLTRRKSLRYRRVGRSFYSRTFVGPSRIYELGA